MRRWLLFMFIFFALVSLGSAYQEEDLSYEIEESKKRIINNEDREKRELEMQVIDSRIPKSISPAKYVHSPEKER